jgi:hypothetical protein
MTVKIVIRWLLWGEWREERKEMRVAKSIYASGVKSTVG